MFKSEQINDLAAALAKAQGEMESAKKDSKAHSYNYSDLASVIAAAKPSLAKNGLSFTQLIEESEKGQVKVTTILLHSSGQFIGSTGSLDVPEMRGVNDAQRAGAAQSYLKRYQLQSLVGLPSEDNDCSSDARPVPEANQSVKTASTLQASSNPPKLTDEQAKPVSKAPSFSRNKTTTNSNDLGI